jgi:hypothetical protein
MAEYVCIVKGKTTRNNQPETSQKTQYMKHAYLLLALPLAFFAAQPLFDAPVIGHPHPHGQEMVMAHMPPPALAPWAAGRFDGFREERMDNKAMNTVHFDAARAALRLTTLRMARQATLEAGANDADMDLDFQLRYGLADLGANAGGADADINTDFAADQVVDARIGKMDNTLADAEINAQFEAAK